MTGECLRSHRTQCRSSALPGCSRIVEGNGPARSAGGGGARNWEARHFQRHEKLTLVVSLRLILFVAVGVTAAVVAIAVFERVAPRHWVRAYQKHVGAPLFRF